MNRNTWNHLILRKEIISCLIKNLTYKLLVYKSHTHTHTHIYIYVCVCVCVCVCVWAINSYRTNYQDDCFSVLHRARDKVQLNILEAIYIAIDRPSLCRQRSSGICSTPHRTWKCGTRPFWWVRRQGCSPHVPDFSQKCLRPRRHSPY